MPEALYAELGGKFLDNKAEAARLAESMKHVEAVLKLLQPGYSVRGISVRRRRPNPWFKRGTVCRSALDVLREAEKPLTAREITNRMLAAKKVHGAALKAVQDLEGAVRGALKRREGALVMSAGMQARWNLRSSFRN